MGRKRRVDGDASAEAVPTAAPAVGGEPKPERQSYPTKEKTPEQLASWKNYLADVAAATSGEGILSASLQYEMADPGQAAFAFNRAKKMLQKLGVLADPKWADKKYRSLGDLKVEFFAAIYGLDEKYLHLLKKAVSTPTTSKGKLAVMYGEELGEEIASSRLSMEPVAAPERVAQPVPKAAPEAAKSAAAQGTKRKRVSPSPPATEIAEGASAPPSAPPSAPVPAPAPVAVPVAVPTAAPTVSVPKVVEDELLKKIKADRLASAVSHPSFQLLGKAQQKTIKETWVSLLVGLGDDA